MAFWSQGASELGYTSGGHGEVKSDSAGCVGVFPDENTSSSSFN
jgi:hypothetical protein